MKTKRIELNVDIIGSQPSTLTKDEERAISDYIRSHKAKMSHKIIKDKVTIKKMHIPPTQCIIHKG
jgi:carbamoylphosphate synthase large subunit